MTECRQVESFCHSRWNARVKTKYLYGGFKEPTVSFEIFISNELQAQRFQVHIKSILQYVWCKYNCCKVWIKRLPKHVYLTLSKHNSTRLELNVNMLKEYCISLMYDFSFNLYALVIQYVPFWQSLDHLRLAKVVELFSKWSVKNNKMTERNGIWSTRLSWLTFLIPGVSIKGSSCYH